MAYLLRLRNDPVYLHNYCQPLIICVKAVNGKAFYLLARSAHTVVDRGSEQVLSVDLTESNVDLKFTPCPNSDTTFEKQYCSNLYLYVAKERIPRSIKSLIDITEQELRDMPTLSKCIGQDMRGDC